MNIPNESVASYEALVRRSSC